MSLRPVSEEEACKILRAYFSQKMSMKEICRKFRRTQATIVSITHHYKYFKPVVVEQDRSFRKLDEVRTELIDMLIANRQYKGTLLHKNQKALYRDFCEQFPDVVVSFCSFNLYLKYLTDTFLNTDLRNAPIKLLHAEFEAQLDFGVCDVIHGENLVRTDYMVISFPRSNAAYVQVLETKNTIAILYYLQKIFVHLRGAPKEIWVDNDPVLVTGVTGVRRPLDLVQQFFDHYNMKMVMCSPARPCQKGNVERNVQICREHLLVPVPSFKSFVSYNKELLLACDKFNQRYSPKLRAPISQAFAEDKKSFNPLPDTLFTSSQIYRYEPDAIGRICLSGKYY